MKGSGWWAQLRKVGRFAKPPKGGTTSDATTSDGTPTEKWLGGFGRYDRRHYTAGMMLESHNVEETVRLGRRLGELAKGTPGTLCIALDGPLGAGKTHLTRGIAEGAGVADMSLVCSPTYVLLNIYEAAANGKTVYHFDAYRMRDSEEFEGLGFEEILRGEAIVVVEWASRVADLLPAETLWIRIEHAEEGHRMLEISGEGGLVQRLAG